MADRYAIDTNVYIRAFRDASTREALGSFHARAGMRLVLHAVVAMELLGGARTDEQRRALADIVEPFVERGRVIVPSFSAFDQAGRVLANLAEREGVTLSATARSFPNDVLIATSCREERVTLVTENYGDFTSIKRHLRGFRFAAPWPAG